MQQIYHGAHAVEREIGDNVHQLLQYTRQG